MRSSYYLDKYEDQSREVIQYIIEYLIYGDKHCSSIFDVFCEFNFMNEFIYLANMNQRSINLQIIKSFSVLILNLTNTTTLYYIFSNNFINQIISNDYEKYDDDFLSYYVNFIKSLSLKIDTTTIQFFFHRQLNSFPLLQSALKLYNHADPMIKNVVRNTILTLLKSISI
jgi:protein CLEC16A